MSDAGDTSSKGPEFLSKKIGPFTGQTWIIVVGGAAIVGYMVLRKVRTGSTGTPLTTDSFTNPNADSVSSVGGGSSSGTVNTPNGNPTSYTNAQWASNVANQLIAQGDDPATTSNALSDYLNGQQLTTAESAIVAVAITQFGEPPQGVLPVKSTPVTTSKPDTFSLIQRNDSAGNQYALVDSNGAYTQSNNPNVIADWVAKYGAAPNLTWTQWIAAITGNSNPQVKLYMKNDPSGTEYALGAPGYWEVNAQPSVWQEWVSAFGPAQNLTYEQWTAAEAASKNGTATAPASSTHTYTVLSGDTLSNISQKFLGTSDTSKLLAANPNLSDPLTPGTVINIPSS